MMLGAGLALIAKGGKGNGKDDGDEDSR
jgi:hypothetical protein